MIQGFEVLTEEQFEIAKSSVAWITVLIAGADGEIDKYEKEWAAKVTKIRSYHTPNELTQFYTEVGKDFSARLESTIDNLPAGAEAREAVLTQKLSQLNDILDCIDKNLANELLKSYRSFAKHVAKASGGLLGFFSVGIEESKLIALPMLNDIASANKAEHL